MQWQHGGLWVDLQGVVGHVERCANSFKMFCTSHLLFYFFVYCVLFIINFYFGVICHQMCAGASKLMAEHPVLSLLAEVPVHGLVGLWFLLLEDWVFIEQAHLSTLQHAHE